VITGAGLALLSIVLMAGSLFADGRTEVSMLAAAAIALLLSVAAVGVTALARPASRAVTHVLHRDLHRVA
jgi:hypothetical protein